MVVTLHSLPKGDAVLLSTPLCHLMELKRRQEHCLAFTCAAGMFNKVRTPAQSIMTPSLSTIGNVQARIGRATLAYTVSGAIPYSMILLLAQ